MDAYVALARALSLSLMIKGKLGLPGQEHTEPGERFPNSFVKRLVAPHQQGAVRASTRIKFR